MKSKAILILLVVFIVIPALLQSGSVADNSYPAERNVLTKKVYSLFWENTRVGKGVSLKNCIVTGNMSLENCNYSNKIITPSKTYDLKL